MASEASSSQVNGSHTDLFSLPKTKLIFHSTEHQQTYIHETQIAAVIPLSDLPLADQSIFKPTSDTPSDATIYAAITTSTIFHPQGGGQPSDQGHFSLSSSSSSDALFKVLTARTSPSRPSIALHFGFFPSPSKSSIIDPGTTITQHVDQNLRNLYSRLHTAGHVLGSCVRSLLEDKIENFDELKANHFPDQACCEFAGLIDGKHRSDIQKTVDELVDRDVEVRIEWWRKREFREKGLERLMLSGEVWREVAVLVDENGAETWMNGNEGGRAEDEETRIRMVNIVGAEVYPCGGTHVPSTKGCGKVTVKKISRAKGQSRVSYFV